MILAQKVMSRAVPLVLLGVCCVWQMLSETAGRKPLAFQRDMLSCHIATSSGAFETRGGKYPRQWHIFKGVLSSWKLVHLLKSRGERVAERERERGGGAGSIILDNLPLVPTRFDSGWVLGFCNHILQTGRHIKYGERLVTVLSTVEKKQID